MLNPNYTRVIPRDLFNEADLLKSLGKLWCFLDVPEPKAHLIHDDDNLDWFVTAQSDQSGAVSCQNVQLYIKDQFVYLFRPLNDKRSYALMYRDPRTQIDRRVFVIDDYDRVYKLTDAFVTMMNEVYDAGV